MIIEKRPVVYWKELDLVKTSTERGVRVKTICNIEATFYPEETSLDGWQARKNGMAKPIDIDGSRGDSVLPVDIGYEYMGHPMDEDGQKIAGIALLKIIQSDANYSIIGLVVAIPSDKIRKLRVMNK